MHHPLMDQCLYEIGLWKRQLKHIENENISMLHRIVAVLSYANSNQMIEDFENFNTRLISDNELSKLFKKEITQQEHLIRDANFNDAENIKSIILFQEKLREELMKFESHFQEIKYSFIQFAQRLLEEIESFH